MRELIKTSDINLLSWLLPTLKSSGLCVEASDVSTINVRRRISEGCHRIMVSNTDYWHARVLLAEGKGELTDDDFIGGQINILQPKKGFRTSIDALLLAAAVPICNHQQVLDLGSGGGAASLALSIRKEKIIVTGIEKHPFLVELARYNAFRNSLKNRVKFVQADILRGSKVLKKNLFDHVMANPPYMQKGAGNMSPYPMKVMATVEGEATLEDWANYAIQAVRPGGSLVFIHRPERIYELIDYLASEASEFKVMELFSRLDSRAPKRCLLRARKGQYVSPTKYQRLVLHTNDRSFAPEVKAVLNKGMALEF